MEKQQIHTQNAKTKADNATYLFCIIHLLLIQLNYHKYICYLIIVVSARFFKSNSLPVSGKTIL
ncbi:MAG: hypothetical protein MR531_11450 [Lachnospiraceae bacterium]|nr:hypothetical protein [Lachnospiraceae bacterium]